VVAGETLRGHEFHYSTWNSASANKSPAYDLGKKGNEGVQNGQLIASYIHLHFLACPELASRFVSAAEKMTPWRCDHG